MILKIIYLVNPVNPVKKRNEAIWSRRACVELRDPVRSRGIEPDCVRPNEANFNTIYLCNLCNLWFLVLLNKPNFPIFDLKMRVSAKNKPNSNAGSWPLAAILPNEPNLHPHIPPADYFLYFTMSVNRG